MKIMTIPTRFSRNAALAAWMLITAGGAWAQALDADERSAAMTHLYISRMKFLNSIDGLTAEQLAFKAEPDRWSIAECAEHITLSEDVIFKMATDRALKAPAAKRDPAVYKKVDQQILASMVDRSKKGKAPEMLKPSNKWKTMDAMIAEFKEKRKSTLDWVEKTDADVRGHVAPHPEFKEMDAYQWVLLLSAHTERHTLQILEVKADPKFPKK